MEKNMIENTELGDNSDSILRQIAASMENFGVPMLLDEKDWETAERMADAGVEAYRKAYPPEPLQPPVKAWGDRPPKTLKGRIGFIKRQCTKPLEEAYWLEVEDEKGHTESWTLSESALDRKLEALGYDRFGEGNDRINYGYEIYDEAMPTCEVTGDLLDGNGCGDPESIGYGLEGFAWRRSQKFQMEERDWQEAWGFIVRLDASDREQAKLRRLIVDSCFLEPVKLNDTGLICPGGGCYQEFSELIELLSRPPEPDEHGGCQGRNG
jgi:hypothetical protein